MNRYEENTQLVKTLRSFSGNYEESDLFLKGRILEFLVDISKSLAIIADESLKKSGGVKE